MPFSTLKQRLMAKTQASQQAFLASRTFIPGGVQGNIKFFEPYPLSFAKAAGAYLWDIDGNRYIDYLLSFGALILGHGHRVVQAANNEVWQRYGTSSFGVPYDLELTMAKKVNQLYPSMQAIRFTNSGLEATLLAIRLGLAFSQKTHVAKFAGHYHGGHEQVLMNTVLTGNNDFVPRADSLGLSDYYTERTVILPFHDWEACERILRTKQREIGVVVLEPVMAGYDPPDADFLQNLSYLTKELGMVLVFDEVKTGFRIALGGAQAYYGVRPDLTALGKVLGGGFPIGAVGGRQEIMQLSAPMRSTELNQVVFHSGTFNGNPVSLLAGLRTIEYLQEPGIFSSLLDQTSFLKEGIQAAAKRQGFSLRMQGVGTIFQFSFSPESAASLDTNPKALRAALDDALMYHGVFSKPQNRFSLSLSHDDTVLRQTMVAFEQSFSDLNFCR